MIVEAVQFQLAGKKIRKKIRKRKQENRAGKKGDIKEKALLTAMVNEKSNPWR